MARNVNIKNRKASFDYFFIDEYKDLSDYIMHKSLNEAKEMISNKLKQLNG